MRTSTADVFFLPFAVPGDFEVHGVAAPVIARRLPDFLHQMLNQGDPGPTGMVEIQTGSGPAAEWVVLREMLCAEEAFDLLPEGEVARAVVVGSVDRGDGTLEIELRVNLVEDIDSAFVSKVCGSIPVGDPVPGLSKLVERVARLLDLPYDLPPPGLMTADGRAFFPFLAGLDGAALLSGELGIALPERPEALLRPFLTALANDPGFGLALRTAHVACRSAVEGQRLSVEACGRFADECLAVRPVDGDGCVVIAEQLIGLGEHERALAWLRHAIRLDPPPSRGLESLGIVYANRGEVAAARNLWLQGLRIDGHPDFCAHLARLAFTEAREAEAWERVLRGLHRLRERTVRADEWGDDDRGNGVLLAYLAEHLAAGARPPEPVLAALRGLAGLLVDPQDRVDFGVCLLECGDVELARRELSGGLDGELDSATRDRAVRAMLRTRISDFERRFDAAVDGVTRRRDVAAALAEFDRFLTVEPSFWLALYYRGIGLRRIGREEEALDLMAEVLRQRPGQADALVEMAFLFDRRGNPKRALECIEDALAARPGDPALLGRRALYQHRLGRLGPARDSLSRALADRPKDRELQRIRRMIE